MPTPWQPRVIPSADANPPETVAEPPPVGATPAGRAAFGWVSVLRGGGIFLLLFVGLLTAFGSVAAFFLAIDRELGYFLAFLVLGIYVLWIATRPLPGREDSAPPSSPPNR